MPGVKSILRDDDTPEQQQKGNSLVYIAVQFFPVRIVLVDLDKPEQKAGSLGNGL